jgi:hypothetical protein
MHNDEQRFLCHECGQNFVKYSPTKVIDLRTGELIDRLLLERILLFGIARTVQVTEQ